MARNLQPVNISRESRYRITEDGTIEELPGFSLNLTLEDRRRANYNNAIKDYRNRASDFDSKTKSYPIANLREAINESAKKTKQSVADLESKYKDELSMNRQYSTLADQIAAITGGRGRQAGAGPGLTADAVRGLSAQDNFGSLPLADRLGFQINDQQIVDDINQARIRRLNNIVTSGNAQIAGITSRLETANQLLASIPAGDPRRASSEAFIKELQGDLKSVQEAVAEASGKVANYQPIQAGSAEAQTQIQNFREFIKLPEERAMDQIQQIDPDTFQAARSLGSRFRDFATQDIGSTADPRTEQLRGALEDLAFQELQLGGRMSPEETRMVQQAVRGRQAQLGNVDGMGPFSEEFAALGMASDQRRLGRAQNALSLLASGQTRSDEARRDKSFRDAANLARMGAASDFIAAGPSAMNLANQRVANQNSMFQNYVASNQTNPGSFNPQANQIPFYQTADPMAGFRGAQTGANIYGSLADYQARTYQAYAGAQAQVAAANSTPNYISAFSNLVPSFSF